MKSVQVRTRGEGGSEIGDFTAYVLYGCPLMSNQSNYVQCVKGSYILRPLGIDDLMLRFIFYHLHLKNAEEKHAIIIFDY